MPGPGLQRRLYVNDAYKFTHNTTGRYTIVRLTSVDPPLQPGEVGRRGATLFFSCLNASFDIPKGHTRIWNLDEFIRGGAFSVEIEVLEINQSQARLRFFAPDYVRMERLGSKRPDLEHDTCQPNSKD